VKVGDLVILKVVTQSDYGIVLEMDYTNKWTKVYWSTIGESWEFYSDDLEVVVEGR